MLRKNQTGCNKGRSCSEQIFALQHIEEQSHKRNVTVNANNIDFQNAFDCVHTDRLYAEFSPTMGYQKTIINLTYARMLHTPTSVQRFYAAQP